MAKIFLSHSRADHVFQESVRAKLVDAGHLVFSDRELRSGENWQEAIGSQLREADVIIVLWSRASTISPMVANEASYGQIHNKLLPILIDNSEIPLGFKNLQTLSLSDWNGERQNPVWQLTLKSIDDTVARTRNGSPGKSDLGKAANRVVPGSRTPVDIHSRYQTTPSASKISIFIAHASNDKPRLGGIVEALVQVGFSLWIDKPHLIPCSHATKAKISRIHMGDDWKDSITNAVSKADKVMSFWSDDAIDAKREQFQYEVYQGLVQRKLFQCKLDPMPQDKIGMPYTFHQIADLSDFKDGVFHYELDYLMKDIVRAHIPAKRMWGWLG